MEQITRPLHSTQISGKFSHFIYGLSVSHVGLVVNPQGALNNIIGPSLSEIYLGPNSGPVIIHIGCIYGNSQGRVERLFWPVGLSGLLEV